MLINYVRSHYVYENIRKVDKMAAAESDIYCKVKGFLQKFWHFEGQLS